MLRYFYKLSGRNCPSHQLFLSRITLGIETFQHISFRWYTPMGESSATSFGKRRMETSQKSSINTSQSTPHLNVRPGPYFRDLITGTLRKRQMMDDFPEKTRQRYRFKWDELRVRKREERGYIEGYQSGDSELDFSEWEDAKRERR
jgi:hypothetical protein